jgi:asparagine N-glycosylation enzyme membrane subunit Stt3
MKISPRVKFAYLFLAKIIGIVLLYWLAAFCNTAGFYGDIILALFIYLTAIICTFKTLKWATTFLDQSQV